MVAMKNKIIGICFALIVLLLLPVCLLSQTAQEKSSSKPTVQTQPDSSPQESPEEGAAPQGQVEIEGRPILTVYETVTGRTPDQRARAIEERIKSVASQGASSESVHLETHAGWTEILVGSQVIMAVT